MKRPCRDLQFGDVIDLEEDGTTQRYTIMTTPHVKDGEVDVGLQHHMDGVFVDQVRKLRVDMPFTLVARRWGQR